MGNPRSAVFNSRVPRRLALALAPVLAAGTLTLAAAPAGAAGSGSISAQNGVLYAGTCYDHAYNYSVQLPAGTRDWTLDVAFYTPDGIESGSDSTFSYPSDPEPTTGSSSHQVCSSELAGRWTTRATLETCDYDFRCTTVSLPSTSFEMRRPTSRTGLRVSTKRPRSGQVLAFRIASQDERPTGYFGTDYAPVHLEWRDGTKWRRLPKGRTSTDSTGRATIRYKWATSGKLVVRAVTRPTESIAGSVSGSIKVG